MKRFNEWMAGLLVLGAFLLNACNQPAPENKTENAEPKPQAASATTSTTAAKPAGKKLTIGIMPKLTGVDYFNAVEQGAKEAGAELGVDVVYDGPVDNDVTKQATLVDTWISRKFDAICIAPNDPDAIAPVLQKARQRGIKILSFDADANPDSRELFVNQATYEAIGRKLIDTMVEAVGPNGKYVILTGSLTAVNQNKWIEAMEAYRKAKYPNLQNLSPTPKATEEHQAMATQVTIDLLKTYPDLQAICAITSIALPGAATALEKENAYNKIFLTGLSTPNSMRDFVKRGIVKKVILWNPKDLGYLTIHAAKAMIDGQLNPQMTQFNCPKLGKVTITDRVMLLGEPMVFTAENIDQHHF